VVDVRGSFLAQADDLIESRGEEVRGGQNPAVRPELVLPHDLLVVDGVLNVDVGVVREFAHRGVEVYDVRDFALGVLVRVDALHQRGLAAARHSDDDADGGPLLHVGVGDWPGANRRGRWELRRGRLILRLARLALHLGFIIRHDARVRRNVHAEGDRGRVRAVGVAGASK